MDSQSRSKSSFFDYRFIFGLSKKFKKGNPGGDLEKPSKNGSKNAVFLGRFNHENHAPALAGA